MGWPLLSVTTREWQFMTCAPADFGQTGFVYVPPDFSTGAAPAGGRQTKANTAAPNITENLTRRVMVKV
jgi:hypothetical protein